MIRQRLSFVLGWIGRTIAACERRPRRDCPVSRHVTESLSDTVVDLDEERLFAGCSATLDRALSCHHDCEAAGPLHALMEVGRLREERDPSARSGGALRA